MNIRIARDGREIASVEDADMLRHAVNGGIARLEDQACETGSEEWVPVRQLLDEAGLGGELAVSKKPDSDPSPDPLTDVIRPRPTDSSKTTERREPRKRHRVYSIPIVLLGLAGLLVIVALSQREGIKGVDFSPLAPKEIKEANALFDEGAELYAKGTEKWYNDDEELLMQALNRFKNAWESLHDGAEHPEGTLISEDQKVKLLRDELNDKIKACIQKTNWKPWPW